jgi:hypothetical protein
MFAVLRILFTLEQIEQLTVGRLQLLEEEKTREVCVLCKCCVRVWAMHVCAPFFLGPWSVRYPALPMGSGCCCCVDHCVSVLLCYCVCICYV